MSAIQNGWIINTPEMKVQLGPLGELVITNQQGDPQSNLVLKVSAADGSFIVSSAGSKLEPYRSKEFPAAAVSFSPEGS